MTESTDLTIEETPKKSRHVWRYVFLLVFFGLAIQLLIPQINKLRDSWLIVERLSPWFVSLGIIAQILSYLGAGYIIHAIFGSNKEHISIMKGTIVSMAAASVGMVAGGWLGGAAATVGWLRKEGKNNHTSTLAGLMPSLFNNAVVVFLAIVGAIILLIDHDLTAFQLAGFIFELVALILIFGLSAIGIKNRPKTEAFIVRMEAKTAKRRKKPFDAAVEAENVHKFIDTIYTLGNYQWLRPLLGATIMASFDMLTLYFMFLASGYVVSPAVLLSGYGLPLLLSKIAFMLPGGVGVVEGAMVGIYSSLGVPESVSVVSVLGYRLISFWIPTILGFASAAFLSRKVMKPA